MTLPWRTVISLGEFRLVRELCDMWRLRITGIMFVGSSTTRSVRKNWDGIPKSLLIRDQILRHSPRGDKQHTRI